MKQADSFQVMQDDATPRTCHVDGQPRFTGHTAAAFRFFRRAGRRRRGQAGRGPRRPTNDCRRPRRITPRARRDAAHGDIHSIATPQQSPPITHADMPHIFANRFHEAPLPAPVSQMMPIMMTLAAYQFCRPSRHYASFLLMPTRPPLMLNTSIRCHDAGSPAFSPYLRRKERFTIIAATCRALPPPWPPSSARQAAQAPVLLTAPRSLAKSIAAASLSHYLMRSARDGTLIRRQGSNAATTGALSARLQQKYALNAF